MRNVLTKTLKRLTPDRKKFIVPLMWGIKDSYLRLLILKCLPEYSEYRYRVNYTAKRAGIDGRQQGYEEEYLRAYIMYQVDREINDIIKDRKSAFELFYCRLLYSKPYHSLVKSEEFKELKFEVSNYVGSYPYGKK